MLNRVLVLFFFFTIFPLNLCSEEKKLIINRLINTDNITFDFKQTINGKIDTGTCILVFDNKLSCDYNDSMQKRVLTNGKTLIVQQKRYDKIYFYPVSNSPYVNILNKNNLIDLIKKSAYQLNNNIELTHVDKNKNKIIIFFKKNNYELAGWRVVDRLQNIINFSIDIKSLNDKIDPRIFRIPTNN